MTVVAGLLEVGKLPVVDKVHAGPSVGDKVVLVPVAEVGPLDGQPLPGALQPVREGAGGGVHWFRLSRPLEFLQMQGFETVLGRVEVARASGVAAEGHVGQTSVGILFEQLEMQRWEKIQA